MEVLYGLHPVEEAIRSGSRQLDHVSFARERRDERLERLIELCRTAGIRVSLESRDQLTRLARTADAAGVDGVVLPERRSAPVTATVAKTSAGASEHVRIARVTNLVRALEQMKQGHVWVLGLDERGSQDYTDYDFRSDCVLVLGREGAGLHDLVKKTCDYLLRIPMAGQVSSLNVSVAGAVVMYEAMRQRRQPVQAAPRKPVKERKGLGS